MANNLMELDGHKALISYDPDLNTFRGEIIGVEADFYGNSVEELKREFRTSLEVYHEVYHEVCQELLDKTKNLEEQMRRNAIISVDDLYSHAGFERPNIASRADLYSGSDFEVDSEDPITSSTSTLMDEIDAIAKYKGQSAEDWIQEALEEAVEKARAEPYIDEYHEILSQRDLSDEAKARVEELKRLIPTISPYSELDLQASNVIRRAAKALENKSADKKFVAAISFVHYLHQEESMAILRFVNAPTKEEAVATLEDTDWEAEFPEYIEDGVDDIQEIIL